jgi:demethylmenaquinone methyltransferase/2-methoxy-6-polyprenyl-1,4-benzoquinol methylase
VRAHAENRNTLEAGDFFASLATVYDWANRLSLLGLDRYWRKRLVESLPMPAGKEGFILDLAAGTLAATVLLARRFPGSRIIAADISPAMLRRGMHKRKTLSDPEQVLPLLASGTRLALADNTITAVTAAFGLRNIVERGAALDEVFRVLKPGGTCHVLEFGSVHDRALLGLFPWYLRNILPQVGVLLTRRKSAGDFLRAKVENLPSMADFAEEMRHAGFTDIRFEPLSFGVTTLHTARKLA